MRQRGRKSAASLEVVASNVSATERPPVPDDLSDEQAAVWQKITNRMPADWFPAETWPLLAMYCRHVVAARRVAQLIEQEETSESVDIEALDRLYKMQEREGRAMSSLATRMRLTQQATYDKSRKKPAQVRRPWEG